MLRKLACLYLVLLCTGLDAFSQTVKAPHSTYVFDCSFMPSKTFEHEKDPKPGQSRTQNPRHFIIQSKAELIASTKCDQNYNFDFDKNILVGVDGHTSGCGPGFCLFNVLKDTAQKKYFVNYVKTNTGLCRGMFTYRCFILIEKPDEDYQVELIKVNSLNGVDRTPQSYFRFMGHVSQFSTKEYLSATISIQEIDSPYTVYFANSNINYEGRYMINLPRSKKYTISVLLDSLYFHENLDIDTISQEPYYKKGEVGILEKNIELRSVNKNDKIILNNIYFETGKYDLREESFLELDRFYMFLLKNPKIKAEISGHISHVGGTSFNLESSGKIAQAVADYLIKKGISSSRIIVVGYGDTQPIVDNTTDDSQAKTGRIEFKIVEN